MEPTENIIALELFFSQFDSIRYKKRENILQAEDTTSSVYFIKSGYIRVYRVSEEGEELTLVILKPGDLFPFVWAVNDLPNHYYLEALTATEVLKVPKERFLSFLESHPRLTYELTSYLLVRFGGLLTRMEYLIFGNAYTKVAATLIVCARRFGEPQGDHIMVNLPLTHKDIATMVGITRETTCLEMKKLERRGLIAHHGRFFIIKDLAGLEHESILDKEQDSFLNHSL